MRRLSYEALSKLPGDAQVYKCGQVHSLGKQQSLTHYGYVYAATPFAFVLVFV